MLFSLLNTVVTRTNYEGESRSAAVIQWQQGITLSLHLYLYVYVRERDIRFTDFL